jgi:hypothetical protein
VKIFFTTLSSGMLCTVPSSPLPISLSFSVASPSTVYLRIARLRCSFFNIWIFLWGEVVSLTPNLEGQGVSLSLGHHLRPVQHGWPYQ